MTSVTLPRAAADPPRWMVWTLFAAGLYNLAWGTLVILRPRFFFELGQIEPPNYPALVQCIGMIIGVYGIGYLIAARDPARHWPVILVGFLGKVFGPIGYLWTVWHGEFPAQGLLVILTNDLVWWLPFFSMLLYAVKFHDDQRLDAVTGSLSDELQQAQTDAGGSLWDLSFPSPLLVVFVRHAGCTFCREALADLASQKTMLTGRGLQPVVVQMGTLEEGRRLLDEFGLRDVPVVSDPERRLYRAFDLRLGTLNQLSGPYVIWRAVTSGVLWRFGIGRMVGHGMQLAGTFVVHQGQIVRAYRNETTADRPNYDSLVCDITPPREIPA